MNVPAARPAPQRCGPDHGVEVALRMRGRAQGSARSLRERLVGARRRGRSAAAGNGLQAPRAGALLDDDAADHAGALVGLAVVTVLTGNVELGGVLLAGGVEEVLRGELVDVDAPGDVVLVEHDVVGEATVVDPGDGVPLLMVISAGSKTRPPASDPSFTSAAWAAKATDMAATEATPARAARLT